MNTARPEAEIREKSRSLGFDVVGYAAPDLGEEPGRQLAEFLERGFHGEMGWLAPRADRRAAPKRLWPEVRSVIVVGANYGPELNPLEQLEPLRESGRGNISVYARNRDYHDVMKKRLKSLGRWMCETFDCNVKVFVDTAPVMEKPLAQRAAIGWQGKHTNLVSREFGSWLFLGEVYTTLPLEPDDHETDHCGSCRKCLDVCPTNAFVGPYRLDATRCISYLTIEHKTHIPRDLRVAMGTRIYGCDDCLAVCPWNKFATPSAEADFRARSDLEAPALAELARLDDAEFRKLFSKSPIKRTGRDRFVRNVMIAIGNTGKAELAPEAERCLDDPSPLVRAMAVWALSRLLDTDAFNALSQRRMANEPDPDVRQEWRT